MNPTITVEQTKYPAARCSECGCKIYPAAQLGAYRDLQKRSAFKSKLARVEQ
jgi:hypothetical protein